MKGKQRYLGLLFLVGLIFCFVVNILAISEVSTETEQSTLGENHWVISDQRLNQSSSGSRQTLSPTLAQGIAKYRLGEFGEAIALWSRLLQTKGSTDTATIHANLGAAYRQLGKLSKAIDHWSEAIQIYRARKDSGSRLRLAAALADQSQAYNALGQFRIALPLSREAVGIAQKIPDKKIEAFAQGALGNAYSIAGDYDQALNAYDASLKLATALGDSKFVTTALNNQVNILTTRSRRYLAQAKGAQREGDIEEQSRLSKLAEQDQSAALAAATRAFQESKATDDTAEVKALLNMARLSPSLMKEDYLKQAIAILEKLPDSRRKTQLLIQISKSKEFRVSSKSQSGLDSELKKKNLSQAISVARNIGDSRSESFALGELGHIYELEGQFSKAMDLTRQAQFAAQIVNSGDSLYRWQWQAGRIYKALGLVDNSILSYKQAIDTLQNLRTDLISINRELQFDIQESVEPVYRELIELLLSQDMPGNISESIQFSELLKLSELQSFFGDDCLEVVQAIDNSSSTSVPSHEAVISSIILKEKTFIILRLPDGSLHKYPVPLTSEQLQSKIEQFRNRLEDKSTDEYLTNSQQIYDLLIRPMEQSLAKARPSTLVFINDGVLRNIPMSALHDGKHFLVEKYPLATRISNDLIAQGKREQKKPALVFGLTVEVPPFEPLPYVNSETEVVHSVLGGSKYLNKDFTLKKVQSKIQEDYPIVHIATHGKFGGTYASTFLQAFDSRISLGQLEEVIRSKKKPIELLTLSACQTAAGDNRSTLGFAGLAARTGVESVLATLWFINDADTVPFIENFYKYLREPGMTKAEALRSAQLKVIADPLGHPGKWSPFILVGE